MSLFAKALSVIKDGMTITFTPDNVAKGDDFLIFSGCDEITCQFNISRSGIVHVWFDDDEPMLLENCPEGFLRSIIKNATK